MEKVWLVTEHYGGVYRGEQYSEVYRTEESARVAVCEMVDSVCENEVMDRSDVIRIRHMIRLQDVDRLLLWFNDRNDPIWHHDGPLIEFQEVRVRG